jgi:hypothetical protein
VKSSKIAFYPRAPFSNLLATTGRGKLMPIRFWGD